MADNNPILHSDLVKDDGAITELIAQLEKSEQAYLEFANSIKTEARKVSRALAKTNSAQKEQQTTIRKLATDGDRLSKAYKDNEKALNDTSEAIRFLKKEQKETIRLRELENKVNRSAKDSYDQLSARYSLMKIRLNAMSKAERETTKTGQALEKQSRKVYEEMNRLQKATGKSQLQVGRYELAADGLKSTLARLNNRLKEVEKTHGRSSERYRIVEREIKATQSSLEKYTGAQQRNSLVSKRVLANIKNMALAYVGLGAAQRALSTTYSDTKALNGLDQSLKAVITDTQELAETTLFLDQLAEKNGQEIISLSQAYIKFAAATKNTGLEGQQTRNIFESISRSAAILQLSTEETEGALKALGQIISKGKIQAEELRGQLGDRLPGAFRIMADAAGVTTAELDKMLEQGQLMAEDLLPLFASQMETAFGADQVERIETLAASEGRLKNSLTELVKTLNASDFFKNLNESAADAVKWVTRNITTITSLVKAVGYVVAAYLTYKSVIGLSTLATRFYAATIIRVTAAKKAYSLATTLATRATAVFNSVLRSNPAGFVATAITTLAGALFFMGNEAKAATGEQSLLNDELERTEDIVSKARFEKIVSAISRLAKPISQISTAAGKISLKKPVDELAEFTKQIRGVNSGALSGVSTFLEEEIIKSTTKINDLPEGLRKAGKTFLSNYKTLIASSIDENGKLVDGTSDRYNEFLSDLNKTAKSLGVEGKDILGVAELIKQQDFQKQAIGEITKEIKRQDKIREDLKKKSGKRKKAEIDSEQELINVIQDSRQRELAQLELNFERKRVLWDKYGLDVTLLTEKYNADVEAVNKKYDDQEAKANQDKLKREFDALERAVNKKRQTEQEKYKAAETAIQEEYNLRLSEVGLMNATEKEKTVLRLKLEKERLLKILNLNKEVEGQLSALTKQMIQNQIDLINKTISQSEGGDDKSIWERLGIILNDEQLAAIQQATSFVGSQITQLMQARVQAAEETVRAIDREIDAQQRQTDAARSNLALQIELAELGFASKTEQAERELQLAQEREAKLEIQRKKAEQDRLKAVRAQQNLDTIAQTSNLVTAASEIFKTFKNPLIAIPIIALMFGSFAAAKIKARQATAVQEFSEGGEFDIQGGSHASGNDTSLGVHGGKEMKVQRGEKVGIFNDRAAKKYGSDLSMWIKDINSLQFMERLNAQFPGTDGLAESAVYSSFHTTMDHKPITSELQGLRADNDRHHRKDKGKQIIHNPDGSRTEIWGNRTRTIR